MSIIRIGINGFGRIGRQTLRAVQERYGARMRVVAVNDLHGAKAMAHLLEHDTCFGRPSWPVSVDGADVIFGEWRIRGLSEHDPARIPWGELGVDVVVEASGNFRSGPAAAAHLRAGARKVVISAPAEDEDVTVVLGVNEETYDPARHHVISNSSCTTNCLAPAARLVHERFGIRTGTLCTVHPYTNDQRLLDREHADLRRARAAAQNIIPTTSTAVRSVMRVLPELAGKVQGYAVRVPTPLVALVDFTCVLEREADTETLRQVLRDAAEGPLKGILGYTDKPLVSSDFQADPRSGVVDEEYTLVQNGCLAKLVLWHDNEWGYACRIADLLAFIQDRGL